LTYPAGYATTPEEGAHASPALLGTVRPKTRSNLTCNEKKSNLSKHKKTIQC